MASDLDDVVVLQITRDTSALSQAGFGTPLILPESVPAGFTQRLRYYSSAAAMLEDDFETTDMAYIMARALMSQSPHPERFAVGRRATAVAQTQLFVIPATVDDSVAQTQLIVLPADPTDSVTYSITINDVVITTAALDGSSTTAELQAALVTAINASSQASLITATNATNDVLVTADTAGVPFTIALGTQPAAPMTLGAAVANVTTTYTITINGTACSYLADANSTQAELQAGILAAINAAVGSAVTATTSTNDVLVTSDVAGIPFTFSIDTTTSSDITAGAATANVGIPDDLAAIEDYEDDWYCLLITQRDRDHIMITAAEIEAMTKIFFAQSDDAAILSDPYDEDDTDADVASELHALGYDRTALVYHPDDSEALDAAVVGICLPPVAGSITWKLKSPSGIDATRLTTSQLTNLRSKSANGFRNIGGVGAFYEGTMVSGEFIDIIHGTDKWGARVQELFYDFLRRAPKVPFTQKGLNAGVAPIVASLDESVRDVLFADALVLPNGDIQIPAYTVRAPNIANISANDRATRTIPTSEPYRITAPYAGAVHKVRLDAVLSV